MIRLARIPVPLQLALANGLLAGCTFATGILLARSLGPEGRGIYGAIFLWALTAANVFAWGGQLTLARDIAQQPQRAAAIYRTAYRLALLGGLAGALCYLVVVLPLVGAEGHYPLWLIAFASLIIPFAIPNAFQVQLELGRGRFHSYNVVRALFAALNFVTVAGLWLAGVRSVSTFLIVLTGTALLASLAAALAIRPSLRGLDSSNAPSLIETVRRSTPLALTVLLAGIAQQSDRLFASVLFTPGAVGIYIVAATLAQVQGTVGEALAQMYFARGAASAGLDTVDRTWLSLRVRQTVFLYAALCVGALVVLPPLVPLIYGPAFTPSAGLLYLLLPGIALQGMTRPFEEFLRGLNQTAVPLRMASAILVVVALAAFTAWLSESRAALAMGVVIAYAVSLTIAAFSLARPMGIPVRRLLVPRPADVVDLWHKLGLRHPSARAPQRQGTSGTAD